MKPTWNTIKTKWQANPFVVSLVCLLVILVLWVVSFHYRHWSIYLVAIASCIFMLLPSFWRSPFRWKPVMYHSPDNDELDVLCYHPNWVDDKINPNGVRIGFRRNKDGLFETAFYCVKSERWRTEVVMPTHFMDVPRVDSAYLKHLNKAK